MSAEITELRIVLTIEGSGGAGYAYVEKELKPHVIKAMGEKYWRSMTIDTVDMTMREPAREGEK